MSFAETPSSMLSEALAVLRARAPEYCALLAVQFIFAVNINAVRYATRFVRNIVVVTLRDCIATAVLVSLWELMLARPELFQRWNPISTSEEEESNEITQDEDRELQPISSAAASPAAVEVASCDSPAGGSNSAVTPTTRDASKSEALAAARHREDRYALSSREWFLVAIAGLLGVCGHLYFVSLGIELTSAVVATVFASTRPLFAAVTSAVLGVDHFTPHRAVGFVLGLLGVMIAVELWNPPPLRGTGSDVFLGYLCLLTSNALYGSYLVVLKIALKTLPTVLALSRMFIVGMVGIALIALMSIRDFGALGSAPFGVFLVVAFGGFVVSPLPYGLNGFAVRRVSPTIVALFSNVEGPITATIAVIFLGEHVSGFEVLGFAIAASGVLIASVGEGVPQHGGTSVNAASPIETRKEETSKASVATVSHPVA